MSDEKKLSERVREGDFDYEHSIGLEDPSWLTDTDKIADEIAALEKRLAEAERILRDTLDAIPGEAIGKKQIVAFLENTHD